MPKKKSKPSCNFLFEIGTEELPPKALHRLSESLGRNIDKALRKAELPYRSMNLYCTPRRLAVLIEGLTASQQDSIKERRGPALTAAFDDQGKPTQAALGFAKSCGVSIDELEKAENDKGSWLVHHSPQPGQSVAELMPDIIEDALARLPIPKRMRWGNLEVEFVRPVHWLVMLLDDQIVAAEMFGIKTSRETRGHRFHHPDPLYLAEPAAYASLLESEGRVMVDFAARREAIRAQVIDLAVAISGEAVIDDALLDEVTGMVEWPVALIGNFEAKFLDVPAEALISAMKRHQKYFHIVDTKGKLMPHFITVSNIESRNIDVVRTGNERVIRPRLADAAFFWQQDRKQKLSDRVKLLKTVTFQKKLGTLHQRSERIAILSAEISSQLNGNKAWAERAGVLSKCDLVTDMVSEFPELQGIMGRYYAVHDEEPAEVAIALEEQYLPRYAGDQLPETTTGQAVSVADKLDMLMGIFAIGQVPSGDKDPFALRRAALGVLRILIEQKLGLDVIQLLNTAADAYNKQGAINVTTDTITQVYQFMMERLRAYYLDAGVAYDVFDAVMARQPTRPYDFDSRLHAVQTFRNMSEAESLAVANKRISNILKKSADEIPETMDDKLLQDAAEKVLAKTMTTLTKEVNPLMDQGKYTEALKRLATLRSPVDTFFDKVLVMTDDDAVRMNRLALLNNMQHLFMRVADISCLKI